jgi:hypothetical protein
MASVEEVRERENKERKDCWPFKLILWPHNKFLYLLFLYESVGPEV